MLSKDIHVTHHLIDTGNVEMDDGGSSRESPSSSDTSKRLWTPESDEASLSNDADDATEEGSQASLAASTASASTKKAKRVSFRHDDNLVEILEIPCRGQSPLSEELEPCDPEKLARDVAGLKIDNRNSVISSSGRQSNSARQDASTPTSKSLSRCLMSPNNCQAVGLHGTSVTPTQRSSTATRPIVKQSLAAAKKENNAATTNGPRPNTAPHRLSKSSKRLHQTKQQLSTEDLSDKLKIGNLNLYKGHRPKSSRPASGSKIERVPRKIKSASLSNSRSRTKLYGYGTGGNHLSHISVTDSLKNKVFARVAPVSIEGKSLGLSTLTIGGGLTSDFDKLNQTFPRISANSHRNSVTNSTLRIPSVQSLIFNGATGADIVVGPTRNPESQLLRVESRSPPFNKKFYAWQMANGVINNAQMETPCISPLWEVPCSSKTQTHAGPFSYPS